MQRPFHASMLFCLMLFCVMGMPYDLIAAEREATPVSSIHIRPGFQIELLRSAQPEEGSWISMTFDDQGRIILAEDRAGLLRLTLGQTPQDSTLEQLAGTQELKHCRGVLYAHQSLYVCETNGQGIHRLKDTDADGTFDDFQLLTPLEYNSRYGHGANQLTLGPDGMIYIAIGNDVRFPEKFDPQSPYRNPQNDWLLPNPRDGDQDDRVGYILKMDPNGHNFTILAGGLRNHVDVAFNNAGEMFTWDADMEWDVGLPWYRPTRINHIVSAGEYGWRWGTGKWPAWMPDSLPSTLDTALGSPTALAFGTKSDWPERYQQALYAADWQNGRLLLIDLQENGASYQGRYEVLAEGSPLNICDFEFGPDGALYFITGGRGSQSGLYRISMTPAGKKQADEPVFLPSPAAAQARQLRHQLEALHVQQDADQLPLIWQHLGSSDTSIRFAARLALENQPVSTWKNQLASTPDSPALHTALMALARVGQPEDQPLILAGLQKWNVSTTSPQEMLWPLRTMQLTLIRQGRPDQPAQAMLLSKLQALPATDRFAVNWLQGELLVALKAPQAVDHLVSLLQSAATQEEQIQYVKTLLRAETGWTPENRQAVLKWLTAHRQLPGGKLVKSTLQSLREDFEQSLNQSERELYAQELELLRKPVGEEEEMAPATLRNVVRNWTLDDLEQALATIENKPHTQAAGRKFLAEALCLRCHQFGDRGGQIGPDLTAVGKRMNRRTLLESILEPSREIDPKYSNSIYLLDSGQIVSGRTTMVNRNQIGIEIDPLTGKSVTIPREEIVESKLSPDSPMPQGLLNTFTAEEIHDLLAYLRQAE